MITIDTVEFARQEAHRFLLRCREFELFVQQHPEATHGPVVERAALRRASLDLTRTLAWLRRVR